MPKVRTNMPVNEVARIIMAMNRQEIETLVTLLTEEGAKLLERKRDIELGKVKLLSREEVFNV